MTKVSI